MKNQIIFCLFIILFIHQSFAQSIEVSKTALPLAKNVMYFEYNPINDFSLNAERILLQKGKHAIGGRIGFSRGNDTDPYLIQNAQKVRYPHTGIIFGAYYRLSDKKMKHHFEAGIGFTILYKTIRIGTSYGIGRVIVIDSTRKENFFGQTFSFRLGYRKQNPGKGFFYKVGITPLVHESYYDKYPIKFRFQYYDTYFVPYFDIGAGWSF